MTAAAEAKMTTYVAVAKANQAWLAWRRGAIAEAQQLGEAALELWLQFPTPFPYQWLAVWPLIGIANMFDLDAEVIEHIKALFGPGQYLPRQPLAGVLKSVLNAWEAEDSAFFKMQMDKAVEHARELNYL